MKVQVTFTVDVDRSGDEPLPPAHQIESYVAQAIGHALAHAEGDDRVSILCDSPIIAKICERSEQ